MADMQTRSPSREHLHGTSGEKRGQSGRRPFHLIVKPIGPRCNLKCSYCFYLKKQGLFAAQYSGRMTDEVLERFTKQYIEAQPVGVKEVNFAWQGGEPTLIGLDFFRRALAYQKRYARSGMQITNVLQTNGTLLDDAWGRFLRENDFLVGISVDGPRKLHDRCRKTPIGTGSYMSVKQGIAILQRYRVEYNILCAVNSVNGDHPKKVYSALKRLGTKYIQFIPIVEHNALEKIPGVHSLNKSASRACTVSKLSVGSLQFGAFLNQVFDAWQENDVGSIIIQNFETILGRFMGRPPLLCVHAPCCGRNLILEHEGTLFSCDHFVSPQFALGNVMTTPMGEMVEGAKQTEFGKNKHELLCMDCQRCMYLQICHGGCPSHRITVVRGEQVCRNYLCKGYKRFYSHCIGRLEELAAYCRNT